jgi:hypothetical protein
MSSARRVRGTSIVGPLLLIGIGTLFLLWRSYPGFNPWPVLERYWPFLLVFVGAGMVLDRLRRPSSAEELPPFPIGSTLGTLAFIALIALMLVKSNAFHGRPSYEDRPNRHETRLVEPGGAQAVRMKIQMVAGELKLEGGGDSLLAADFYHGGPWATPDVKYKVEKGVGELDISQEGGMQVIGKAENTWNLKITEKLPVDLNVDVGAGDGELRLAKVDLTRLNLNLGVGQVSVDLTGERAKDLQAEIQGGVGRATVKLPKNVGVVAYAHGGLGSIDTHGLRKDGDKYVNEAYGKSPNTIHLNVEGGIGQITLDEE